MISSEQIISEGEMQLLSGLIDSTWRDISGDGVSDETLAWESIRIESSAYAVEISFILEVVNIGGAPGEYPCLHVRHSERKSPSVIKDGRIYYQSRGERIIEISVLRQTLRNIRNSENFFENIADVCVAFKLDTHWISFYRAAHFSDSIIIQRTSSRDDVQIPDVLEEWESDLNDQYELKQQWISIGSTC
jgi:hypothetical protein